MSFSKSAEFWTKPSISSKYIKFVRKLPKLYDPTHHAQITSQKVNLNTTLLPIFPPYIWIYSTSSSEKSLHYPSGQKSLEIASLFFWKSNIASRVLKEKSYMLIYLFLLHSPFSFAISFGTQQSTIPLAMSTGMDVAWIRYFLLKSPKALLFNRRAKILYMNERMSTGKVSILV